jgi:hypothetical protein
MARCFPKTAAGNAFSCLEFRDGTFARSHATNFEQLLNQTLAVKSGMERDISGLCMVFEDISPDMVLQIDALLNVGREFFHKHLSASKFPQPGTQIRRSAYALLSSQCHSDGSVHIPYKRILHAGLHLSRVPYSLRLDGHAERYAGQMPPVNDSRVLIADASFSMWKKNVCAEVWICES